MIAQDQQAAAPRHEVEDGLPLPLVPDLRRIDQHEDLRLLQVGRLDGIRNRLDRAQGRAPPFPLAPRQRFFRVY